MNRILKFFLEKTIKASCKATLEKAALNARLTTKWKGEDILSNTARLSSGAQVSILKESITDESNIVIV